MDDNQPAWLATVTTVLGLELRRFRDMRKLTRQQLADAASSQLGVTISYSHLGRIEQGRTDMRVRELLAVAKVLKVDPAALLGATSADDVVAETERAIGERAAAQAVAQFRDVMASRARPKESA